MAGNRGKKSRAAAVASATSNASSATASLSPMTPTGTTASSDVTSTLTPANTTAGTVASSAVATGGKKRQTMIGLGLVYIGFPFLVGIVGLVIAHVEHSRSPSTRDIVYETDFILPFLLSLTVVIVMGIQTKNFTGKAAPLVQWPKKTRIKKIIYKNQRGEIVAPPSKKKLAALTSSSLLEPGKKDK